MREGNIFYLLFCKIGFVFFSFFWQTCPEIKSDFGVQLLGSLVIIDIFDKIVRYYLMIKLLLLDDVFCMLSSLNL